MKKVELKSEVKPGVVAFAFNRGAVQTLTAADMRALAAKFVSLAEQAEAAQTNAVRDKIR
jgi:phage-related tail protein